jgi:hypothetical protein
MIELVTAAGFSRASPIMQGVLAHPDGLVTTPNEVVKALLRQAGQRAGREPLFSKREPAEQLLPPARLSRPAHRVKQIVR